MKQGTEKRPAAERARAARRAAKLRREAEERVEAQRKLDDDEPISVNDMLAMLGSSFRLPEQEPANVLERLKAAWEAGELETEHAREINRRLKGAEKPRKRRSKANGYDFTAEEISKLRDEQGLSWRQVAVNLDLGSPASARRAYTALTGVDYRESKPEVRRTRTTMGTARTSTRKFYAPEWNDESDQEEIIGRVEGARLIVRRTVRGLDYEEDIMAGRVVRMSWDGKDDDGPLAVTFIDRDTGGTRTVRVADIKEIR